MYVASGFIGSAGVQTLNGSGRRRSPVLTYIVLPRGLGLISMQRLNGCDGDGGRQMGAAEAEWRWFESGPRDAGAPSVRQDTRPSPRAEARGQAARADADTDADAIGGGGDAPIINVNYPQRARAPDALAHRRLEEPRAAPRGPGRGPPSRYCRRQRRAEPDRQANNVFLPVARRKGLLRGNAVDPALDASHKRSGVQTSLG
ncbi:hypothetical protein DFH11DRAFT_1829031 [Phellopilus nigrolimitatus]|nr:hypothetical protein DFH11DRAFT_1829031 [Phellopilus nigrolimitatus]